MRKIYSKAGWLHYPELEFYYTQGEENVEPVQFVLPKNREEVDLTALSYQIKVVSEDYGTEAAWILPKKMTDEHILLDWEITREFTAMPGRAFLTLTGTDSKNNVVAKWTGHPVQIRKDPKGTQPVPPPDKLEQFENQVNQAVEKITGALEKADDSLDGMVPVLEDATKTANTLIEHSKKLEQTVNVLENQTIPQFTAYVDKQKQSIDAAASNAQNAATAAQASAASAESARQNTEKIQQQVVIESKSVSEKYNQVIEMTGRVEEATSKAEDAAKTATSAVETVNTQAKQVEQWKNQAVQSAQTASSSAETAQSAADTATQKASEASTSAQNAALSQQAAQQAKTDAQSARDAAAKSAESAAKSAETAAQMASAHLKEIIPLSIDAEGWSAVEGEDGMFSHPITHEKITATSYLTLNPGSDTLLSAFSEIGYAGGYIKNDGGNVNWFIKAGQKPSSPFSVQLTLEQAKEGIGPIYTSLNTQGGGQNTDLPPLLDNFCAVASIAEGNNKIIISADKMEVERANELSGALWVYADHIPADINDGTKIELTREELISAGHQTDADGQFITSLESKSKLKLGQYNSVKLQWYVGRDKQGKVVLTLSEKDSTDTLGRGVYEYDAAEPDNPDNDRKIYGNNRISVSNANQWLNSSKGENEWFEKQHDYDEPPTYQNKKGFLNEWSATELQYVADHEWETIKASVDGGGKETFIRKISLLSTTELGLEQDTGGTEIDIFDSDESRAIGMPYYTRTPYPLASRNSKIVLTAGKMDSYNVNTRACLRPVCYPLQDLIVSNQPDEDGCYTVIGVPSAVTRTIDYPADQSFYVRQFTFNKQKQYQTIHEGAVSSLDPSEFNNPRKIFEYGDTAPANKNLLWIQPNGLTKFWNGSEWTAIAGVYAEEVSE